MASVGNATCVRLDNVIRGGEIYESPFLYVKGTWLPFEFSVSVCDGSCAWIGRADKEFVLRSSVKLGLTESEYVDRIQLCLSKQQPDVKYELKWGDNGNPELLCYKELPYELVLRLPLIEDGGQGVAVDIVQFLLDAYHGISEELAKKTRAYERAIAAKDQNMASLKKRLEEEGKGSPEGHTNGQVQVGVEDEGLKKEGGKSARGKRKAAAGTAETGPRKRTSQLVRTPEAMPPYQSPPSQFIKSLEQSARPIPLSALGYKQPQVGEDPIWSDKKAAGKSKLRSNGVTDDSPSDDGHTLNTRQTFLNHLSELALASQKEADVAHGSKKRASAKKQRKSVGKSGGKSSKKPPSEPSFEDSLDQVEDVVEKGIKCVDKIGSPHALKVASGPEVSSPLPTPVRQPRKTPKTAKKLLKASSKAPQTIARSGKRKMKPTIVETSLEETDEPSPSPSPEVSAAINPVIQEEDREIDVQSSEFNDFDKIRTEAAFIKGNFWALYDDQDGMPRFYGRITDIQTSPFQATVEWLEPFKPSLPVNCLVKTAHLSPSCGEFTFGTECTQDLAAFSHIVDVEQEDAKRSLIKFFPETNQIWALYRAWDRKQSKKDDGDDEFQYDYDLVQVQSKFSSTEGVEVVPLIKVEKFKSLFTVADASQAYNIPHKQLHARFSHRIPAYPMGGSEYPGVPVGALELDPASTPSVYLRSVAIADT